VDYGTDFLLVNDDVVFTPDGDIELISGPACVAQDIGEELKIVPGRLIWDKSAGSSMPLMLNDTVDDQAVIDELERAAIADVRVDPVSVAARKIGFGKYRLEFTPLGVINSETLDFDLRRNGE
jgi:hypothetical protein